MKKSITLVMFVAAISFCSAQNSNPVPINNPAQDLNTPDAAHVTGRTEMIKHTVAAQSSTKLHAVNTAQSTCDSLLTTFAAGNAQNGNMFDIVATSMISVISFDVHPQATSDYEVYYKSGTFVGSEANAAAWTLVGSATNVAAQPTGSPTHLPIAINVTIPAGQTYGWYITCSVAAGTLNYTNGTTQGAVLVSNSSMQIMEGIGIQYPFGTVYTPRDWNGVVHYCLGPIGINESTLSTFSTEVIPNPFSSTTKININSSSTLKNAEMKIFNSLGQEVTAMNDINSNEIFFDRKTLNGGLYFFAVKEENAVVARGKFVIE